MHSTTPSARPQSVLYSTYSRHLLRAKTGFFTFSRHYTKIMDLDEAAFLQHLLNHASCDWNKSDENGYFECTNAQITEALHISDDTIKYLLKKLTKRGYISTDRRGLPAKRFIKIQIEAIEKALDEWEDKKSGSPPDKLVVSSPTGRGDFAQHYSSFGFNDFKENDKYCVREDDPEDEQMIEPLFVVNKSSHDPRTPKVVQDITIFDKECATILLKGLQAKNIVPKKSVKQSTFQMYASSFVVLRAKLENDTDRIEQVLEWYVNNIGGDYVPQALSASSFVDKFINIELAMKRGQRPPTPSHQEPRPQGMEISEDAVKIVNHLKKFHWPKLTEQDLLYVAQVTLTNYKDLRKRISAYGMPAENATDRNVTKLQKFAKHLCYDVPGRANNGKMNVSPISFTSQWMEEAFHRIVDWPEWGGSPKSIIFHSRAKSFLQDGNSFSVSWCGESGLFEKLLKEIGL